ncbi:MAG TPA: hypothetical protein VEB59_07825 [Gemmatimonadales bacterium]|nr:hypothetical protein [Gemmatimonadales bacterium]
MLSSLHLDLNSFFASVEQQHDPKLRNRPIAVVPLMADSTFVLAASYEAKKHGVKTGVRVGDAKNMCPGLVLVQSDSPKYVAMHNRVLQAVDTVWPVHKVWSIDEVECRLTGPQRDPEAALDVARRIKHAVRSIAGDYLRCSIGIGPSQLIAKLGTDLQKPDGLVMIQKHELPQRLFPLRLTEMAGIGTQTEKRLLTHRITTFEQLAALTEPQMVKVWGSVDGLRFHRAIHGLDYAQARTLRRSIGHEHVLAPGIRNEPGARGVLVRLLHKATWRARSEGYVATRLHVWAKTDADRNWEAEAPLEPPTNQLLFCLNTMLGLWSACPGRHAIGSPRKVGVTLAGLEAIGSTTPSLFEPVAARPTAALDSALDRINDKFGRDTIYAAAMHGARKASPPPIAFSRVPTLDEYGHERPKD